MIQQPLCKYRNNYWAVICCIVLISPMSFAAGSGIEDMEPPFGSGYTPELESEKLTNKGYRSYQQALYYATKDTPNGDAKSRTALKNAERFLRRAAKKDQKNIRAFALLGTVLALRDQPRKAIGAFNFALQLNAKYYDAWLQRAKVLLQMGLLEDVRKSFVVLERNEPEMATDLLASIDGWIAARQGRLQVSPLTEPENQFISWRTAHND